MYNQGYLKKSILKFWQRLLKSEVNQIMMTIMLYRKKKQKNRYKMHNFSLMGL